MQAGPANQPRVTRKDSSSHTMPSSKIITEPEATVASKLMRKSLRKAMVEV